MKADMVLDALAELQHTIKRLHEPHIITVEVGDYRPARIHLHVTGDPTEIIQDIGLGLIDKGGESDPDWDYFSITDTNGVEVYWLELKKAPDAATSEGPRDNDGTDIISDDEEEVKEDHHESEN